MNFFKEINYLFTKKMKFKLVAMVIIILLGSLAELLGVSIILPVVNLATDTSALFSNKWCVFLSEITGLTDPTKVLILLISIVIAVYVVKNLYLTFMTYMVNRFAKNTRLYFSTKLMKSYMKQPYSFFLNKNSSEIIRSVNNDTTNLYTLIANLLNVFSYIVTAIFIISYLAITNLIMTIVVAGVLMVCLLIIMFFIRKKVADLGKKVQFFDGEIIKNARQSFEGIKEVKIRNKEKYFIEKYCDVYCEKNSAELVYNLFNYIPKYLIETICIVGIMGYLIIALIFGGDMTTMISQLAVFAVAAFRLLPNMNSFFNAINAFLYNKASLDVIYHDIKEIEEIPDDVLDNSKNEKLTFENKISVNDISFSYNNPPRRVINNISFEIARGESIAFVGESGCGKTTLVDLLIGILFPESGCITVDDECICNDLRCWHNNIGYIPQNIFLIDDTIRRNVAFGYDDNDIEDEKVWEALRKAQLDDFVDQLPDKLNTKTGEAGTRLSGGQRQRIGIARALYYNPEILVFDEATSALDSETEKDVMKAIENLHGTKTIIMIAHRLSTIENCDHVFRVENGKIQKER